MHLVVDLFLRRTHIPGADLESKGNILEYRHVAEKCIVLEDEAHPAIARGAVGGVFAIKQDGSGVGKFQAGDDAQKRGLAGTGQTQQGHQFARGDLQTDVVEGGKLPEALGYVPSLKTTKLFISVKRRARSLQRRVRKITSIRNPAVLI